MDTRIFGEHNEHLAQKFHMAEVLFASPLRDRLRNSDNALARGLVEKAGNSYELALEKVGDKKWVEANAVIDSVLRDLKNAASLLNQKSLAQDRYEATLKRVEAFVYPEWKNLSELDKELLNDTEIKIKTLQDRVSLLVYETRFDEATEALLEIFNLKSQLLQRLDHSKTVVYDLLFDTPDEEFNYLTERRKHYLGLLDDVLANIAVADDQTLKLVDQYMLKSDTKAQQARQHRQQDAHLQASRLLEDSIQDLSTALKLLGIRI